jgi:hypothetical protein
MRIEDIQWWQWIIISLLLGWLLAYMNQSEIVTVNFAEQQGTEFERDILHAPVNNGANPWTRNVVVYPLVKGRPGYPPVQVVVYDALVHTDNAPADAYHYEHKWFPGTVPYAPVDPRFAREAALKGDKLLPGFQEMYKVKPDDTLETITAAVYGKYSAEGGNAIQVANQEFRYSPSVKILMSNAGRNRLRPDQAIYIPWNPEDHKTVLDWLGDAEKDYPWVHHKFAWWKVPQNCNLLWIGSSFAIIGVFWPITLTLLTTAGLGRPQAKDDYDISRFGSTTRKKKATAPKPRAEMSEEEFKQLTALNETLAASVKEGLDPAAASPSAGAAAAPSGSQIPERKFTAAPVAALAPIVEQPKEGKEFTGEFYPVARPPVHDPLHEPAPHSDKNPDIPPDPKRP